METCLKCGSNRVHRSRAKSAVERFRRQFTMKRLFRCDACGWRGWGDETERVSAPAESRPASAPDLRAIDTALAEAAARPESEPEQQRKG